MDRKSILVIDDEVLIFQTIKLIFSCEFDLYSATSAQEAFQSLSKNEVALILLDVNLPDISGLDLLRLLQHRYPAIPIIMLTGEVDPRVIVKTLQSGAFDYVVKGIENMDSELRFRLHRALEYSDLRNEKVKLQGRVQEDNKKFEIIGSSAQVLKLKHQLLYLKGERTTVLINGESGTGKELIARALNIQDSELKLRPFISVNCAAIPENLAESELFGHEKGSFTGAVQKSAGKFVAAQGGDIFLDEIGELSLAIQAKLLRVIQERVVIPVGSTKEVPISVRIIAATHRDLREEVAKGRFREDLYYRLSVISLHSPPLRERTEDIEELVGHFLIDLGSAHLKVSKDAFRKLKTNLWTGNIRALKNCIERARVLAKMNGSPLIETEHIQIDSIHSEGKDAMGLPKGLLPENVKEVTKTSYSGFMDWAEKTYLQRAYFLSDHNKTLLSQFLGVTRDTVWRKLRAHHLDDSAPTISANIIA
jgi:two-component system, NtrC family, response regulator AtoC